MSRAVLQCVKCKKRFLKYTISECDACGGILLAEYDSECLEKGQDALMRKDIRNIASFADVLPEIAPENWITLQECNTPYLEGARLGKKCGLPFLWLKDETRNPTGSFKDRAISLCVSMAVESGVHKLVVASSGNGAASVAAYGAKAGMETTVAVPESTPSGKVIHAQTCGANICRIQGSFDRSFQYAKKLAEKPDVMNLTTTFLSPIGVEGYKTIAYEIYMQAKKIPDYLLIPVGAGPILYGIYKGFRELMITGKLKEIPRLVAVQSEHCAPIVRAWRAAQKTVCWDNPSGIASAISDPLKGYEDNGDLAVEAINNSNGFGITVNDTEILQAGRLLAGEEGLFVEPSSAAAFAGVLKARDEGNIKDSDSIAVILTGSGLKDSNKYAQ